MPCDVTEGQLWARFHSLLLYAKCGVDGPATYDFFLVAKKLLIYNCEPNVALVKRMTRDEECGPSNLVGKTSDSVGTSPTVSISLKKIVFWVLLLLVVSLLVIALTTFVLLMQEQKEISKNSELAGYPAGLSDNKNRDKFYNDLAAAIVQEKLNKTMQDVLRERAVNATQLIKDMIPIPDAQDLLYRMNNILSNLTSSIIQKLQDELGISYKSLEEQILMDLGNLSETVLNRLKEELEIDQEHFDMAVHRAVEKSSKNKLSTIRGKCELLHEERCYFLLITGPVRYASAKYFCERQGAKAANIYDDGHYRAVMSILREKMLPMDTIWVGMTRNSLIGSNYLENGEKSTFVTPWASGYPRVYNASTSHLAIKVTYNTTAKDQGFFNIMASKTQHGILCEM